MESPLACPDSPTDPDDVAFPCQGCGEILEEGKAFELAGNRWHINCFRCNTCGTLLDSDANLLLLGDGSLICNNCTYSCSNCNNKIEDLAILTGDQAFCANCFKCRNCKKKIENLRYARTSQGIFCMDCHEKIQARRRKRTTRNGLQRQKPSSHLDKSLPSLPPSLAARTAFSPELETPSDTYTETPTTDIPSATATTDSDANYAPRRMEQSPPMAQHQHTDTLSLPPNAMKNNRQSTMSQRSDVSAGGVEQFLIPLAFDPTPPPVQSQPLMDQRSANAAPRRSRDYFGASVSANTEQRPSIESQTSSPHIAYQEKSREPSADVFDTIRKRTDPSDSRPGSSTASPHIGLEKTRRQFAGSSKASQSSRETTAAERFRLQEAPKTKRSGASARSSRSEATTPHADIQPIVDETRSVDVRDHLEPDRFLTEEKEKGISKHEAPVRQSQDYEAYEQEDEEEDDDQANKIEQLHGHLAILPQRGDSLERSKLRQTIPRKDLPATSTVPPPAVEKTGENAVPPPSKALDEVNGSKVISKPIDSPLSKSILDTPNQKQHQPSSASGETIQESFVAPRAPPVPPYDSARSRNESMSTNEPPVSANLPRYSAAGDFTMDEDMARILGEGEPSAQESFLRRVSNSVRHGRSYSDKGGRLSREHRWPQSPKSGGVGLGQDISSPSSASQEHRDELSWFRNELRRERQKTVEREGKVAELEATLESSANIKQVNSELREKRSTMVVLDTQKEIVVRELEVLTEHIAAAKRSGDPLDLSKMRSLVLRDFAEALQRLKDSFAPQIEDSIQKRNDLVDEISGLTQMKDKSFQEFEQLSLKNAQLAELNNQLVHQIQELYKANSGPLPEVARPAPNGLGIYSHHKDRSQVSIDSRDLRKDFQEAQRQDSGTTLQPEEAEPVTVLQGPHVVNIRKGQPKKFDWKKGGQKIGKGVTKGLKGAFSSTQQSYSRELQYAENTPYGATQGGQEYGNITRTGPEPVRGGFGASLFSSNNPRAVAKPIQQPWKHSNGSSTALAVDAATTLYGSDLEERAQYEGVSIPVIVTRCIQEVQLRGMDVEGIYRKSGGTSQIQVIKEGFERSPNDFDLSDLDLDIHAVTSALKQYFRRLPIPLITYDVYDKLLETTSHGDDGKERVEAMHRALGDLPKVHRDVLEFLIFHLKRVVGQEEENLMTSMNIAVVFAPTIMRPESLSREMTDTAKKNEVVQYLVENCEKIFHNRMSA